MPEQFDPAVLAFLRARTQASFAIADKHLSSRAFMLGDRPTNVDFSMAGYVFYPRGGNRLRYHDRISGAARLAPAPRSTAWLEAALRDDAGGV